MAPTFPPCGSMILNLISILEAQKVEIRGQIDSANGGILGLFLAYGLPLLLMGGLWFFIMRRSSGVVGPGGWAAYFLLARAKRA